MKLKEYFPLSWKGWIVFLLGMAAGSVICRLLQAVSTSDVHVPMIFVLMVLIILFTIGQRLFFRYVMKDSDNTFNSKANKAKTAHCV